MNITGLDHVAITVKNVEVSVEWYATILNLKKLEVSQWGGVPVFMVAENNTGLAIFPAKGGNLNPMPAGKLSYTPHMAFAVSHGSFNDAKMELKGKGIEYAFQDHSISHSIYFRDPDDYCIEITAYLSEDQIAKDL